jgi:hypothetical protein
MPLNLISCIDVDGSDTFIGSAAKTVAAALKVSLKEV